MFTPSRFAVFILLFARLVCAQSLIEFPQKWKFSPGDSVSFAVEKYSDAHWKEISVPAPWETQGYPSYDGYAWYRVHFDLQTQLTEKQYFLLLGKIDDADETYLNGEKIGRAGSFPPAASSAWNEQRIYPVSAKLLKRKNVISVRVYDMGGPGGIGGGDFGLFAKRGIDKLLNVSGKPIKSFHSIVTSNGLFAGVYDEQRQCIANIYPHIFQSVDEQTPVKPFAGNVKLNLPGKLINCGYLANTHIIHAGYSDRNVYYFAPFVNNVPVFCIAAEAKTDSILKESFLAYQPENRKVFADSVSSKAGGVFRKYYLLTCEDSLRDNYSALQSLKNQIISDPRYLEREAGYMLRIFDGARQPGKLSVKESDLFQQSIAVLKMAQVSQNEVYPRSRGQILASLPPGIWNISWVRDGCYSLNALTRLGLYKEAANYIRFVLGAESNHYISYIHSDKKDYGIGTDYQVSVCRYFGNGSEESDFNSDGPNIELDGFGLFLWAFSEYVIASEDSSLFLNNFKLLKNRVAFPLLKNIGGNGMIRAESGSWERHLPGKQYVYTSVAAAKGLKSFGEMMRAYRFEGSERYTEAAAGIIGGIQKFAVDSTGFIKGTIESRKNSEHEFLDAAVTEAFNFFPENFSGLLKSHSAYYKANIGIARRGYRRVNNGDWYDRQEWVFLNCRMINALRSGGLKKEASRLRDWIVSQSALNNNLIAELYNESNAKYEGAVPMVGFGAGAFILSCF